MTLSRMINVNEGLFPTWFRAVNITNIIKQTRSRVLPVSLKLNIEGLDPGDHTQPGFLTGLGDLSHIVEA